MENNPCKFERGESAPANVAAAETTIQLLATDQKSDGGAKRTKREKAVVPLCDRAGYTPAEFAALYGKSITWGYRQIYAQRVRVITGLGGVMLIPASEVARLQAGAAPLESRRRKRQEMDSVPVTGV